MDCPWVAKDRIGKRCPKLRPNVPGLCFQLCPVLQHFQRFSYRVTQVTAGKAQENKCKDGRRGRSCALLCWYNSGQVFWA